MASAIHHTTCPLDCPDTCALEVTVADGAVTKIAGARRTLTDGFICTKVKRFGRRLQHATRLTSPLRRVGTKGEARFVPISWDDAVGEITDRFRAIAARWGGEAILPYHYGGSNGLLTDGFLDSLYFARLGASRLERTICAAPATAVAVGMYGKMPGVAFQDYAAAKCIIIWGANPKASSIHHVPWLRRAKANGAYIAVVDPRVNFTDREIDLHLPVLPGTDLPLALAMIRIWNDEGRLDHDRLREHATGLDPLLAAASEWDLDRAAAVTGVAADRIATLARRYAESHPAVIRCGWGIERNRNGGHAIAAVLAMPALLWKFGVRGGGYTLSNSGGATSSVASALGGVPWNTRSINMTQLARVLNGSVDPPIKGLFVYNCNPVATVPDQRGVMRGLEREDLFTVVFEQVMTDTAAFADIVLPATTFLEHDDIRVGYGSYVAGGVRPVVSVRGTARPNADVFAELGRSMGFTDEAFSWEPARYLDVACAHLRLNGEPLNVDVMRAGGTQEYDFPGTTPVQFHTVWPQTADGRAHLTPAELGDRPYRFETSSDTFPLCLISPATPKLVSSTLGEFNLEKLVVTMHPADASPRGIATGQQVRVFNALGEVQCCVEVGASVRPGVVSMPKGAWRAASANGYTATALCPDHVSAVAGGACFNDARVEVETLA